MFYRQIAKILRGKATPLQITLACVLGAMLGFVIGMPGALGVTIALVAMLVILNANLLLAGLMLGAGKLAALALMPVSFQVGRLLLDGPTTGVFRTIINAPVGALMGFESYVVTGGLLIGAILGVAAAGVVMTIVGSFRRRMARLEEDSELYRKLTSAWWARLLTFILIGKGHGKATYAQLAKRKFGNPIRILGVVLIALLAALGWVGLQFLSEPITTAMTRRGLERITGATVDLTSAVVDPKRGEVVITGLAMADPGNLSRDLFRATRLSGDLAGRDLLRRRIAIESLVVADAAHGQTRTTPGRRIGPPPAPPPPPQPGLGDKSLEDYLADARQWKEKLEQAQEIFDKLNEILKQPEDQPAAPGQPPRRETLAERLRREVETKGYTRVFASHLIEGAPTVVIRSIEANGIRTSLDPDRPYNLQGANLSTHPSLLAQTASIKAESVDGKVIVRLTAASGKSVDSPSFELFAKDLNVDETLGDLQVAGVRPVQGGRMDASLSGSLSAAAGGALDSDLLVALYDSTISLAPGRSAKVANFSLPIGIRGRVSQPIIRIDSERLADALAKAGANQLAAEVRGKVDEAAQKVQEKVEEKAKGIIGDILGGGGKK